MTISVLAPLLFRDQPNQGHTYMDVYPRAGTNVGDMVLICFDTMMNVGTAGVGVTVPAGYTQGTGRRINYDNVAGGHPRGQVVAWGPWDGNNIHVTWTSATNGIVVSVVTVKGSAVVVHGYNWALRSYAASVAAITAPDPAPTGPAGIFVFGCMIDDNVGSGFTQLSRESNFVGQPAPSDPGMFSSIYWKAVAGGGATTMPSRIAHSGLWHSMWVDETPDPTGDFGLGHQFGGGGFT